jgi:hypothetical protein
MPVPAVFLIPHHIVATRAVAALAGFAGMVDSTAAILALFYFHTFFHTGKRSIPYFMR